jgi:DNA-binding LytR/AlgR family response regulator
MRTLTLGLMLAILAVSYSALHILGMGLLRELAYRLMGLTYAFPWSHEVLYEFRKDLFAYTAFVVMFWLVDRANGAAPAKAGDNTADTRPDRKDGGANTAEFWLRDGNTSLLIDVSAIISVTSAGNYVEYQLTDGRRHLIRTTLQAQEARLAPLGFARVHRSRLVNVRRIASVAWRASGDFEIRLDTGDIVPGSRRFKAALAGVAT